VARQHPGPPRPGQGHGPVPRQLAYGPGGDASGHANGPGRWCRPSWPPCRPTIPRT
jgi:hypothetical protein